MPTLTAAHPLVVPVVESRPQPRRWFVAAPVPRPAQPTLDLRPAGDPYVAVSAVDAADLTVPGLPDARAWSLALAVAVLEVLSGRRPAAQLSRWLDEPVLAALAGRLPRRRAGSVSPAPTLRSVRVQHPGPGVAEVSVHGRLGDRSVPLALRLAAGPERWLCTALELPPHTEGRTGTPQGRSQPPETTEACMASTSLAAATASPIVAPTGLPVAMERTKRSASITFRSS